jgi:hypothetical protein
MDFPYLALRQRIERVRGNVGMPKFIDRLGKNARHVERDIALPQDGNHLMREVEFAMAMVRVAIVPPDKTCRRMTPGQVFTGYAKFPLVSRSTGENDGVMRRAQVVETDVAADLRYSR